MSGAERTAAHVTRRDFLRLRARGVERVLELSCESLYMRWVEARAADTLAGGVGESGPTQASFARDGVLTGEPATAITVPTRPELLQELERCLGDADMIQVRGREWLVGDFGREVGARLDAFRARGGRVA